MKKASLRPVNFSSPPPIRVASHAAVPASAPAVVIPVLPVAQESDLVLEEGEVVRARVLAQDIVAAPAAVYRLSVRMMHVVSGTNVVMCDMHTHCDTIHTELIPIHPNTGPLEVKHKNDVMSCHVLTLV